MNSRLSLYSKQYIRPSAAKGAYTYPVPSNGNDLLIAKPAPLTMRTPALPLFTVIFGARIRAKPVGNNDHRGFHVC